MNIGPNRQVAVAIDRNEGAPIKTGHKAFKTLKMGLNPPLKLYIRQISLVNLSQKVKANAAADRGRSPQTLRSHDATPRMGTARGLPHVFRTRCR